MEMSIKRRKKIRVSVQYTVLVLLALYFLFPVYFVLSRSLMHISEINSLSLVWFPRKLMFENYAVIGKYLGSFLNTLLVVAINGVFVPLTGAMIAFPFARYKFKGKQVMFMLLMSTTMVPWVITSIPTYILYSKLGLINKLASQWVGAFFGGPATQIFLIIQFMRGIPKAIDEAAYIDGANKWIIFTRIVLPQCKNIIVYLCITTIIGKWNDYMGPLVYIWDKSQFTMAVAFYYEYSAAGNSAIFVNEKMAMAIFMTIPSALMFAFFQNTMINGIKIGALKG